MNSKEFKTLVKDIRENIKSSNYGEAIQKCQRLIESEPTKPLAYLLLGAACSKTDQKSDATRHLRKALEYSDGSSTTTLALQGLVNCAPISELPEIYNQLLDLLPENGINYYEKLYGLASDSTVAQSCFEILKNRIQTGTETYTILLTYLGKIWLANNIQVTNENAKLFRNSMDILLDQPDMDQRNMVYKNYLKWLYKQGDYVHCIRNACNMTTTHPEDIYSYEWICKIYCETHEQVTKVNNITWRQELQLPILVYAEKLLNINGNSNLGLLVKAFCQFEDGKFIAARQLAVQAQEIDPAYKVTLQLMALIHMELGAYKIALLMWTELDNKQESYAECLSYENNISKLTEAVEFLRDVELTEKNVDSLARCYFKLGDVDQLRQLPLSAVSKAQFLMSSTEALQAIDTLETFEALLLSGKLHMELRNYTEALNCVLKATRMKPHVSECFDYLGRLYQITGDISRARKCFEKCINLNAVAEQAVEGLSAIYQQLGEEDLNEALLLNTLRYLSSDESIRLQYKLSLHFLNIKKWDNAIQYIRIAIKHHPKNLIYWESLGDAYVGRGSYNSAIRVFQKVIEMSPTNLYAQLQVAVIKTTIRMYSEAITDFDVLLQLNPSYLPGLRGAAEAHIGLAQTLKAQNIYGRARQHFQLALNHLQSAFMENKTHNMLWLWRLTATVFLQTAQLPFSLSNLDVNGSLANREETTAYLSRQDILKLSQKFYLRALMLKQNTYLWYELALCSYYSAIFIPEEEQLHFQTATRACKMAIKEDNNRWQNWNLLGVIYLHDGIEKRALAQHCLIQALHIDRKSFTVWTNLGVLYLLLREARLANEAFKRAQQSSPIYPNAWIGQAMVAEIIGEWDEAFDLFRHCQQFDYHPEAAIGYGHWVCKVLSNPELQTKPHNRRAIEHMHADISAMDAINWYVLNQEGDCCISSLTFQGFLCTRQKLYKQALSAFTRACQLAKPGADRDKLYTNLGYLYLKLGQPENAVSALNTVTHATFKPIIGLALAYYRSGQLQESYSIYNSVLSSVVDQDEKASTILVAMASMVYAFQGETDTKTLLYQCILLKDVPVQALFSACALGILHGDTQLGETIMTEIKAYNQNADYCADVSFLTAHYVLLKKGLRESLNYLQGRIRMFPQSAELRKIFVKFLLDYFIDNTDYRWATSQMALIALTLGHRQGQKLISASAEAEMMLLASRAVSPINKKVALNLTQSAIRLNPVHPQAKQLLSIIVS